MRTYQVELVYLLEAFYLDPDPDPLQLKKSGKRVVRKFVVMDFVQESMTATLWTSILDGGSTRATTFGCIC